MTILWSTVMRFLENEVLNLGTLLVFLFVQGMLIYFIKIDYRKDVCRKISFKNIIKSFCSTLIVMGIPKVKEEVDEFIKTLDDLLRNSDQMKKKSFLLFCI
ncbi:MAG: hypothetical protein ACLSBH_20585 [Coprobacillus cateniformis]